MSTISQYDLEVIMQSNGNVPAPSLRGIKKLGDAEFLAWCLEGRKLRDTRPDRQPDWPQVLFDRYMRGEELGSGEIGGLSAALWIAYQQFKKEWYEARLKERRSTSKSSAAARRAEKKAKARARGRAEYEARLVATGKKKG